MKVQTPWIPVSKEIELTAQRFRVPVEVIASVKGVKPEILAKAYKAAHDRQYFDLLAATSNKIVLFGRIQSFRAERVKVDGKLMVRVILRYPTTTVVWYVDIDEFGKRDAEEWYRLLTEWIYTKARLVEITNKQKKSKIRYWLAEKVVFARVNEDIDTAKHLIGSMSNIFPAPALAALGALIGYNIKHIIDSPELQLIITLYGLPLVANEPIHGLILTRPGMGKTSVAMVYRTSLNWEYFAEIPSTATLVGDARTGRARIVGVNGLWFDEVDKWGTRKTKVDEFIEVIEILLTGMEQGVWKRSKGGEKVIEVHNEIPVVFSGNIAVAANAREKLMQLVTRASADAAKALEERVTYAATIVAEWSHIVMESTWERSAGKKLVSRPSVLRGLVSLLREAYTKAPEPMEIPSRFKGRYARHFKRVYKALMVLWSPNPLGGKWADNEKIAKLTEKLVEGVIISRSLEDLTPDTQT